MAHNQDQQSEEDIIDGSLIPNDDPIFVRFRQQYLPASSIATATVMLSTRDIVEQIFEHTGKIYAISQVYDWMVANGYKDEALDNSMTYVWVLKTFE